MVNEIDHKDAMIQYYAKKIMGFAYSKLQNKALAEDLSQDILFALWDGLKRQQNISDLDGFVYTICCFTWSKYLRKNKKHWNQLDVTAAPDLQDDTNIEHDIFQLTQMEQLRREIAYLTKLHRDITIMFYYNNQSGDEISRILGIPHSTVRWHLSQIKKKLKEGIVMDTVADSLSYKPQTLMVGHDGYISDEYGMVGLGTYRIVDNICLACYGKKLTIEDIARKLSVASAYLEHHINELVYMNYLKVIDKNKYTTNFFIAEHRHRVMKGKFHFENIGPYAEKIYHAFAQRYDQIKAIGFLGSELDKDFVLWAIIPLVSNVIFSKSTIAVLERNSTHFITPKRKDGTEHWVSATLIDDTYFATQTEFTLEEVEFYEKSEGNGIKKRANKQGLESMQLDTYATIRTGLHWRIFDASHLNEMNRIAHIIRNNESINDLEMLMISTYVEEGYVEVVEGRPRLLIPFLNEKEYTELELIFEEIISELGETLFVPYIEEFAKQFDQVIPKFISVEERNYHKYKIYPQYAILYWLSDQGYLRYPSEEEAKRMCTVVWRKGEKQKVF